jgi:drug/metabolite transporter (DMT)-like permease
MTFFSAIFVMPLADAVAISFVNPIITALFSGWFLGERMRPAVWVATLIAFAGVLIMLRPNFANFGWVAVLPLISAVAMSTMIILNRMVSQQRSIWAAQFYIAFWAAAFLSMASLIGHYSVAAMQIETWPGCPLLWRCIVVACTATFFHIILYIATMRSSAAAIAPAVYIQMLVSGVISVVIFGDPMDLWAVFGAILIMASGLLIWRSSRSPLT